MIGDEELIVTVQDRAAMQYCCRGTRAFFAQHGLNYDLFLKQGIPASQLEATQDAMAIALVEEARRRVAESGQ